jgi:hypothetical protein
MPRVSALLVKALLAFVLAITVVPVHADLIKAEDAATVVIFDMDANDYVAYRAVTSIFGDYLELTFADNTPRDLAKKLIDAIVAKSGGATVKENFNGPSCSRF